MTLTRITLLAVRLAMTAMVMGSGFRELALLHREPRDVWPRLMPPYNPDHRVVFYITRFTNFAWWMAILAFIW